MVLHLQPEMTIAAVNDMFRSVFPYLKLEFFSRPHRAFQSSAAKDLISDHDLGLKALNPDFSAGELPLNPTLLVRDLERLFEEKFGLYAQVFRKSGSAWLATSATDDLSLAEQNARGEAAENPPAVEEEKPDYREQD